MTQSVCITHMFIFMEAQSSVGSNLSGDEWRYVCVFVCCAMFVCVCVVVFFIPLEG